MARQEDRSRVRAEYHFPLQPGTGTPPVELTSVVIGLFDILGAGIEMLRVKHFDSALLRDADGPLNRKGIASYRKGVVASRLIEDIQSSLNILDADKGRSGIQAADLFTPPPWVLNHSMA